MAHIWFREREEGWVCYALDRAGTNAFLITGEPGMPVKALSDPAPAEPGVELHRTLRQGRETWSLLAHRPDLAAVGGEPVLAGVKILSDLSTVRLPGCPPMVFSTQRAAVVKPFPQGAVSPACARCGLEIRAGAPAVRCPNPDCGLWYHQGDTSDCPSCWTYAGSCACGQNTDLDAGLNWTPEDLP